MCRSHRDGLYALSGLGRLEASGIRLPMSVAVIGLTTFLITERKRAEVALRADCVL
jgi:hypothetical protein